MRQYRRNIKKYFRQINLWLPCSRTEKKQILNDIQHNVKSYLLEHPDASLTDIEKHFGSPKTIAASYIESEDRDKILSKLHIRRIAVRTMLIVALTSILLWGCVVGWAAINEWKNTHGYQTDIITEEII